MNFIVLFLVFLFSQASFSGIGFVFSPEEVDTKAKAVATVHQIATARLKFNKAFHEYLSNPEVSFKEKKDLVLESAGLRNYSGFRFSHEMIGGAQYQMENSINFYEKLLQASHEETFSTLAYMRVLLALVQEKQRSHESIIRVFRQKRCGPSLFSL